MKSEPIPLSYFFHKCAIAAFKTILKWRIEEINISDGVSTILVFAPHQDDEILGCGGAIIKNKTSGAKFNIVFITDGRNSHKRIFSQDLMSKIREEEAIEAGKKMSLNDDCLTFLRFRSGELNNNWDAAIGAVVNVLKKHQPKEIFLPYIRDNHREHYLTNKIISSALKIHNKKITVYEYPVWFWNQWPWVDVSASNIKSKTKLILNGLKSYFYMLKDFRYGVNIRDVIAIKQHALDMYKSQMTKLQPKSQWLTLYDVSNGEFLKCFFHDYEIFYKYEFEPEKKIK